MIPTIDFHESFRESANGRRQIAAQIDQALRTFGSFYLYNHGIEQSKIDKCFEWVCLT